ncbi:spore germination protein [Paenibacillus sp. P96]|uniref:Spore germination protein n=1 Tax=Paenibacillus zeirhizosphaerae TaxID=2987519 RepID=A0ABT9FR70_9BACL|nr:spore germination protein [Paenibacillus sp. P96]MDP4097115.1 spore germination protein [Paenibacillus sp. P96]
METKLKTENPFGPEAPISKHLDENVRQIQSIFGSSVDLIMKEWSYGPEFRYKAVTFYYETLMQKTKNYMKYTLQDLVDHEVGPGMESTLEDLVMFFEHDGVSQKSAVLLDRVDQIVKDILDGHLVIFLDQWDKALSYKAFSVETRQVTEPVNESVVQGPRESTVESLEKNMGLLRIRLKTPSFRMVKANGGGKTNTDIVYAYLSDVVDSELLNEFERRFEAVKQMEVLETSYIEQILEDSTYSPFPQHQYTERPDVVTAALLRGKIAVLVQGSSGVLLCPGLFTDFFQSSEDYYQRTLISSLIRFLRVFAFIIALTLPSIYIALTTYHTELVPTVLLLAVIDSREGIPLPAFFEALLMEFFFELLREAGVRLPRPVGSAVSIVGALIIGDAAISAGIASPIMVIIVALTGIASFAIPQYGIAISLRILQFPLMISASLLGGFGVMIMLILFLLHLTKLRSLGQPYLSPLAPLRFSPLKDVFIRAPIRILQRGLRDRQFNRQGR